MTAKIKVKAEAAADSKSGVAAAMVKKSSKSQRSVKTEGQAPAGRLVKSSGGDKTGAAKSVGAAAAKRASSKNKAEEKSPSAKIRTVSGAVKETGSARPRTRSAGSPGGNLAEAKTAVKPKAVKTAQSKAVGKPEGKASARPEKVTTARAGVISRGKAAAKSSPKSVPAKAPSKAAAVSERAAAGKARTKAAKAGNPVGRELAELVVAAAAEHKPLDPVLLDLSTLSSVADWFFIASAENPRQMSAIAEKIIRRAREKGVRPLGYEGLGRGDGHWVLVDLGDVVVHIFNLEAREMYDLEGLWTDAPRCPVKV